MERDTLQLSAIGRVQQLSAIATDAQGRVVDPPLLFWVSDDPSIVRVDQSGAITAVRDGTANVSVLIGTVARAATHVRVRAGVVYTAHISAVINPLMNASLTRDSVGVVVHDPRVSAAKNGSSGSIGTTAGTTEAKITN